MAEFVRAEKQARVGIVTIARPERRNALTLERRLFERLFDTHDQREGMQAFLEKRRPVYQGR